MKHIIKKTIKFPVDDLIKIIKDYIGIHSCDYGISVECFGDSWCEMEFKKVSIAANTKEFESITHIWEVDHKDICSAVAIYLKYDVDTIKINWSENKTHLIVTKDDIVITKIPYKQIDGEYDK